jgi:hypothetical protein
MAGGAGQDFDRVPVRVHGFNDELQVHAEGWRGRGGEARG